MPAAVKAYSGGGAVSVGAQMKTDEFRWQSSDPSALAARSATGELPSLSPQRRRSRPARKRVVVHSSGTAVVIDGVPASSSRVIASTSSKLSAPQLKQSAFNSASKRSSALPDVVGEPAVDVKDDKKVGSAVGAVLRDRLSTERGGDGGKVDVSTQHLVSRPYMLRQRSNGAVPVSFHELSEEISASMEWTPPPKVQVRASATLGSSSSKQRFRRMEKARRKQKQQEQVRATAPNSVYSPHP